MNIQKLKHFINRPEYFFRPWRVCHRLFKQNSNSVSDVTWKQGFGLGDQAPTYTKKCRGLVSKPYIPNLERLLEAKT